MEISDICRQLAEMLDHAIVDERLPTGDRMELPEDADELLGDGGGIGCGHRNRNPRRRRRRGCRNRDSTPFHRILGAGEKQNGIVGAIKQVLSQTDDQTIQNVLFMFRGEGGSRGG